VKEVPPGALIVDRVDIIGAETVDDDDLKERLATAKTKRALGGLLAAVPMLTYVDALTVEYRTYDPLVLDRDLQRVKRWLRARGFYDAQVRAGRVVKTEEGHVRIEIEVTEGKPVLIESAKLDFPDWRGAMRLNAEMNDLVRAYTQEPVEGLESSPRFDEERYDELKKKLRRVLTDNGYAYAEVEGKVDVNVAKHSAKVELRATAGPFCHFDTVTIEGLGEIPEQPVQRALGVKKGDTYSTEKLEQGYYALADLEVFASVEIDPQLSKNDEPPRTQVPIEVVVRPIKLRGVKLGLGSELGSRFDIHGVLGWEDRNFLGGLRKFEAELKPALLFFPLNTGNLFDPPEDFLLIPEARVDLRFEQPGVPEPRSTLFVETGGGFFRSRNFAPLQDFDEETTNVVVHREVNGGIGLRRKFRFPYLGGFSFVGEPAVRVIFVSPASFNLDEPPPGFTEAFIPYLELQSELDFRRNRDGKPDAQNPALGALFSLNAQFAALGSAEDVKLRPELRVYAPLGPVVFALRWTTGFLFPFGYGESMLDRTPADEATRARDFQLLSYRGLFSGGPNSNRGYLQQRVGPHEVVGFLTEDTRPSSSDELLPSGGVGLWELSGELRFPLAEQLVGVLFLDASDVVRSLSAFRVTHPHLSPGAGLRYVSPVGRIRFDLGFRPNYLQHLGEPLLRESEGGPEAGTSELPLAFHVAIGEAI
jgi:outer membrane protein insertion porin family/translocation and assembly module TamA